MFLQGCGGNINPAVGIGYEVDCRDTKNRVGLELGGEVLKVAARIRTDRRPGARRTLGSVPNILFTPWDSVEGDTPATLAAVEDSVALDFVELPPPRQARDIHAFWEQTLRERRARDAPEWTVRVATKYEHWARRLVRAAEEGPPASFLRIQAVRLDGLVVIGIDAETFYETGQTIRQASSYPDTFVLGYTNGLLAYLPRPDDHPAGGWRSRRRLRGPGHDPPGLATAGRVPA